MDAYLQEPYVPQPSADGYPNLKGYSGPTVDAVRCGDSPLALLFFFLPVLLRRHIAACSNEYNRAQVTNASTSVSKSGRQSDAAIYNLQPSRSARFAKK